jgi:hypothetical protein
MNLTAEQHNAHIEMIRNKIRIRLELDQVVAGYRGFVSHTARDAKTTGVSKEWVSKMAAARGLVASNHGRFGLNFTNPNIRH